MKNTKQIYAIIFVVVIVLTLVGCESYAEKKAAAQLKWEKTSARAKVSVARDLFANGRIDEAAKTVSKCLNVDPENPQAHLLMGEIRLEQARFQEAKKYLQNALELDESLDRAWFCLASINQQENQLEKARQGYEKAVGLKPACADYIIALAEIDIAGGLYQNALDMLIAKTRIFPGNFALKVETADVLSRMARTEEAINLYNQALLLKPKDEIVTEALGYCYITDQQWDKAVEMFEMLRSNNENPDESSAYLDILAMCSMNAGQYGKAVKYYDRLSLKQRDNAQIWLQMGQAALGMDAPKRALACAARALVLEPGSPDAIALQGCALYLNNDYNNAIKTFEKITAHEKMAGFAWLMTGRCYQQLGQSELADRAYQNAAELKPDSELITLLTEQKT